MLLCGPTGCGKTLWVYELLKKKDIMINPAPEHIIWAYKRWQPIYEKIKNEIPMVKFIQGLPSNMESDDFFDSKYPTLFIVDEHVL